MAALSSIAGIGPWTRQVIAMRALGDPDAFPESDLGVRHAAERLGLASTPAALVERSQRWRPWRAYAVQYLWAVDDHRINDWPPRTTTNQASKGNPMSETLTSTIESPIGPLTLIARDGVLTNLSMREHRHMSPPHRVTPSSMTRGSRTSRRNSTPTSRAS